MMVIAREETRKKIENDAEVVILEVLHWENYQEFHLPRAVNMPFEDQFEQQVEQGIPDKSQPVLVYSRDATCSTSVKAAMKLYEMGYDRVYQYEAGKEDWKQAGLPVERGT